MCQSNLLLMSGLEGSRLDFDNPLTYHNLFGINPSAFL